MAKTTSRGKCELCGKEFGKRAMTKHLASCLAKTATQESTENRGKSHALLQLRVEGRHQPQYWIYVETRADSKLGDLDAYLRNLWLECCGHLSGFTFPKAKVSRQSVRQIFLGGIMEIATNPFASFGMDEPGAEMDDQIVDRVNVGDEFFHEYDFGSTTELKLQVLSKREGVLKRGTVRLLARNLAPEFFCKCGKPATHLDTDVFDEDCFYCDDCSHQNEELGETLLPVVNSPRMGICGYCG